MASSLNFHRTHHTITASSPQKNHTLFLSNLDQWYTVYMKNIFFFQYGPGISAVEERLQQSLSKVLDSYYPWAGRLRIIDDRGTKVLDCNNAGVLYATAKSSLFLEDVQTSHLKELCVPPPDPDSLQDKPLLTVQVTHFAGNQSFAVGVAIQHVLGDATTAMSFILNWASVSSGNGLLLVPDMDRTALRAREPPQPRFEHPEFVLQGSHSRFQRSSLESLLNTKKQFEYEAGASTAGNRKTYALTFDEMARLKESIGTKCSSFEAMAAVLWRAHSSVCYTDPDKELCLRFNMDIRNVLQPPLEERFAGNAVFVAMVRTTRSKLLGEPVSATVERIQESKRQITDEYLRSALDFLELHPDRWRGQDAAVTTSINGWPRVVKRALELDFGWGKPARVEFPQHLTNQAIVICPLSEQGVDISVPLHPEEVTNFDSLFLF